MKKGESTGKKDKKGKEIFEGDKVLFAWSWSKINGELTTSMKIHIITRTFDKDSQEWRFLLGPNRYNIWKSEDVLKISEKDFKEIGIPIETLFHFDSEGKGVVTDVYMRLGLTEAEGEELTNTMERSQRAFMFGMEQQRKDESVEDFEKRFVKHCEDEIKNLK